MTRKKTAQGPKCRRCSSEFKQQTLLRALKDGVPTAARELGLEPAPLYAWRARAQHGGQDAEAQLLQPAETARLKPEVARLEEEVAFLEGAGGRVLISPDAPGAGCVGKWLLRVAQSSTVATGSGP